MSIRKHLPALLAFLTLLSRGLFSQIVLQGTISDNDAIPVQNALVELIDQANEGRKFSGHTNPQGQYSISIDQTGTSGVPSAFPKEFRLLQNYPNPFNPSTVIGYELPYPAQLRIEIHNILGQKIKTLADGYQSYSSGQLSWDATDDLGQSVPAGIYICSLSAGGVRINRKMLLSDGGRGGMGMASSKAAPAGGPGQIALGKGTSNLYILRVTGNDIVGYEQQNLLITANTVLNIKTRRRITDATRDSVLTSMSERFGSLVNSLPRLEAAGQMAAALKSRPEFEDAAACGDGNAWGRFTDGRIVIYANNRDLNDTPGAVPGKPSAVPQEILAGGNRPSNVPESNSAFIGTPLMDAGPSVSTMAALMGYNPHPATTVAELMNTIHNAGIFFLDTHGGYGDVINFNLPDHLVAFYTGTRTTKLLDKTYEADLDLGRLVPMTAPVAYRKDGSKILETHYAFTKLFVEKYMSFSKNSLVWINACESATHDDMVKMFHEKGASVYAGFIGPEEWGAISLKCPCMFFSRTLGYNMYEAEDPPQRPFDWASVFAWMRTKEYDKGSPDGKTKLAILPNPSYDKTPPSGPLAPSIAHMYVDPIHKELWLWGIFGLDPGAEGEVLVEGNKLDIKSWEYDSDLGMDRIKCDIPDKGARSYGEVQVKVRGIKSNKHSLSRYKGDFTLTRDTKDGRKFEVKLTLQFRVDLLGYRNEPGGKVEYIQNSDSYVVHADMASTGESTASGATGGLTWSGHFTDLHNNVDGANNDRGFTTGAWFNPEAHKMQLYLAGSVKDGIELPNGVKMNLVFGTNEFAGRRGDRLYSYVDVKLDQNFNIEKGSGSATKIYIKFGSKQEDTEKIEWDEITCDAPPLANMPR
jgi:hypothetical protein